MTSSSSLESPTQMQNAWKFKGFEGLERFYTKFHLISLLVQFIKN